VDLRIIARGTPGFSGADLANLVNEAALMAARRSPRFVTHGGFRDAKDKVMMGAERRSMVMTEDEKKLTAYHEAGHAIVGLNVPAARSDPQGDDHPARPRAGLVLSLPERDQLSVSFTKYKSKIAMAMGGGGRGAEIRQGECHLRRGFGHPAGVQDRARHGHAVRLCRRAWYIDYANEQQSFLGPYGGGTNHSEAMQKLIDEKVKMLVDEGYETAKRILTEQEDEWERLAQGLLEYETLTTDQEGRRRRAAQSRTRIRRRRRGRSRQSPRPGEAGHGTGTELSAETPDGQTARRCLRHAKLAHVCASTHRFHRAHRLAWPGRRSRRDACRHAARPDGADLCRPGRRKPWRADPAGLFAGGGAIRTRHGNPQCAAAVDRLGGGGDGHRRGDRARSSSAGMAWRVRHGRGHSRSLADPASLTAAGAGGRRDPDRRCRKPALQIAGPGNRGTPPGPWRRLSRGGPAPSDIEIARAAQKKPIQEIGAKLGIPSEALLPYGHDKAKVGRTSSRGLAVGRTAS
jgi:hypothetical protein